MAWLHLVVVLGMFAVGCGEQVLYQRFEKNMWSSYIRLNEVKLGMVERLSAIASAAGLDRKSVV